MKQSPRSSQVPRSPFGAAWHVSRLNRLATKGLSLHFVPLLRSLAKEYALRILYASLSARPFTLILSYDKMRDEPRTFIPKKNTDQKTGIFLWCG